MLRLQRLQYTLFFILIGYCIIGITSKYTCSKKEMFPFFSWFLFSKVPSQTITSYRIVLHTFNGEVFDPPQLFTKTSSDKVAVKSAKAWHVIQRMGKAYEMQEEEKFDELKILFEDHFLNKKASSYELVRQRYNLIEKWKTGKQIQESIVFFAAKGGSK